VTARQMTRAEILALPPVITLSTLARVLDVSEPTVRRSHHNGELERLGIRVSRLGAQYRVVTATVWEHLAMADGTSPVAARSNGAGRTKRSGPALRPVREGRGSASA
jgi:hypothetical protein